jgi:hypothetical protein
LIYGIGLLTVGAQEFCVSDLTMEIVSQSVAQQGATRSNLKSTVQFVTRTGVEYLFTATSPDLELLKSLNLVQTSMVDNVVNGTVNRTGYSDSIRSETFTFNLLADFLLVNGETISVSSVVYLLDRPTVSLGLATYTLKSIGEPNIT